MTLKTKLLHSVSPTIISWARTLMRKPPTPDADAPVAPAHGPWNDWPEAEPVPTAQDAAPANVIPLPVQQPRPLAPSPVAQPADEQQDRLVAIHNELEAVLGASPDWPETWARIRNELEHADAEVARQAVTGSVPHVRAGKQIKIGMS
jgi:hypothetical protein